MRAGLFCLLVLGLAGCIKNVDIATLTPEQREKVDTLPIRQDGTNRPHEALKVVEASACQADPFHSRLEAEELSKRNLRVNAVALGADAVIGVTCQQKAIDWMTSCWNLIVCSGTAIRFTDK